MPDVEAVGFGASAVVPHLGEPDRPAGVAAGGTLALDRIVDASNPQEPVNPSPTRATTSSRRSKRRRLPIGNLTRQLFAPTCTSTASDHFVTEVLARQRLSLHPAKTHVAATSAPATFLGFELRPGRSSCRLVGELVEVRLLAVQDQHGHPTEFRRGGGGTTS